MACRWGKWCWLGVLFAVAACTGKKRPFADEESSVSAASARNGEENGHGGDGGLGGELPLSSLAAACERDLECASGFCVDGVCCDTRCAELCTTCIAEGSIGSCSAAPSDPACGAFVCAGGTECRGYDQTQLEQSCAAFGECRTGIDCAPLDQPEGTPCLAGTGVCNGLGECVVVGKALLGAACGQDADCGEGHCVVGAGGTSICCDAPCDGVCQQCSAEGRCDQAPAHDMRCALVDCPDDNVCRDYPDSLTENLCRSLGQCKTAVDCPSSALQVESACECNADGTCNLARGQVCATSTDCGLAACAPSIAGGSICCAVQCGEGLACSRDGARCVECEGESVRCDGMNELRCISDALVATPCSNGCTPDIGCNEQAPVGFLCETAACQPGAVCQPDVGGAKRCCSRDCSTEGRVCAENGSCACPEGVGQGLDQSCLLQAGDPCGPMTAGCDVGLTCVDGVCCTEACAGACESCNVPGSVGSCTFAQADTSGCSLGQVCVARGQCRVGPGGSCAGNDASCVSNSCEPQLGGNGATVCCGQACDATKPFCSRDASRCVQCEGNADCSNGCQNDVCLPLRELGESCDVAAQCGSGICTRIDGTNTSRCCGQCQGGQVCNDSGACECPPNQVLVGTQCRRLAGQVCAAGIECQAGNCETAVDGQSRCCALDCGDPSVRRCAQDGSACIDQRNGVGVACASGAECQNGNCVDGVCCAEPCDGTCERCNAPGQAGLCVADIAGTGCGSGLQCFGQGLCRAGIGGDCSTTPCGEGVCVDTATGGPRVCCATDCLAQPFCNAAGTACVECGSDSDCAGSCVNGSCRVGDGSTCIAGTDCGGGSTCAVHYLDTDDDEFALVGAATESFCVSGAFDVPGYTTRQPGAQADTDCCEDDGSTFPGSTPGPDRFGLTTRNLCGDFDYNCDGEESSGSPAANRVANCAAAPVATCARDGNGYIALVPGCGEADDFTVCGAPMGACVGFTGVADLVRECL